MPGQAGLGLSIAAAFQYVGMEHQPVFSGRLFKRSSGNQFRVIEAPLT
jgi:hypothetical protein